LLVCIPVALAQTPRPPSLPVPRLTPPPKQTLNPNVPVGTVRDNTLGPDDINISFGTQEIEEGKIFHWRVNVVFETREAILKADEVDYNQETGEAKARGHVYFKHYEGNEELWAERVDYNVEDESGKFYEVRGSVPGKVDTRPGLLTTTNPFVFQGDWAERLKGRYILYDGFITNCRLPKPMWTLRAPKFDIIPNDRAIAYKAWFKVRRFPLFYTPMFYKSLQRQPRKSGFLTPNIGNSSRRGKMLGAGYYWAINRSYDMIYRSQLFTQRGFAHTFDVRGKPREDIDFNLYVYGVNDRGLLLQNGERVKQGGYILSGDARADLGRGFYARGTMNYLSSFQFRQAFTETFTEAISSEVQSIGFVTKHWSSYGLNFAFTRKENFFGNDLEKITIQKLPSVEFNSRDRLVTEKVLPVWVSLESAAGLLRRDQPLFETRNYVQRVDVEPRIMTAIRWKDFSILPSYAIRETYVASSFDQANRQVSGDNISRHARELAVDILAPSVAKIFDAPKWMGTKIKHVIEPRASFRYISGIDDFSSMIRFDETELLSNTKEMEISLANRFYVKRASGQVVEAFSWQVWHRRYFDPTFGGALTDGDQRNVLLTGTQLTAYTFFTGPRRYSPIVSVMRAIPVGNIGLEWRSDYDPFFHRFTNSSISAEARVSNYFFTTGHSYVRNDPRLSPPFNQFFAQIGVGNDQRRGWNASFRAHYDFKQGIMQFATTQVTYNTDCCGLSFQYRRFPRFGPNPGYENQFRIAFAVANIGSFGTLKRQERIF
jgi:LPS-assembly protein